MANKFRLKKNISSIDIYTPYDATFVSEVKKLGSKWNDTDRCWTVSSDKLDEVKALIKKFYDEDVNLESEISVKISFTEIFHKCVSGDDSITILGVKIADANCDYLANFNFNGTCEKKFKDGRIRRLKIAEGSVLTISVTISDYEKYTKFGTDGYTAEIIK